MQTKITHHYVEKPAIAQRTKIKNTRKDFTHQFTNKLVKASNLSVVGKIKSKSFTSSKLVKSVYDVR
ncbi:hypothetical protein ACT3TU_01835 [Psychrobacter sp. AOP3-A1-26]